MTPPGRPARGKHDDRMTMTKSKSRLLALFAAIAAMLGIGVLTSPAASAQALNIVNVTCPSYIGGGGGCQAIAIDRAVPGATGTIHVVVDINWLADHSKYNVYDEVVQNHTSRTQFLDELEIANSCCIAESHVYTPDLTIAINGTYDQHVAPGGSSFLGKYLSPGQGYRGLFYMKNSGTSTWFYASSDALP